MRGVAVLLVALGCAVGAAAQVPAGAAGTATPPTPALPSAPAPPLAQAAGQASGGALQPPPPPPDPRRPLPARPGALTLDQVLTLADHGNPGLLAARRNLDAVRAQEIQAGVRQNPVFGLVGSNVSLPAEGASNPYAYSAQISRLFERGQKRRWRLDLAHATTTQTADQLHDQERATQLAVKQAFINMLVAKASLALSDANLADFRHEVDINHFRYTAGDIGKLDYERLDLQLAQYESDHATAEINLEQASDQLQTLMGVERPRPEFDILGDVVPPSLPFDLAGLEARALAARPDYQAAVAGVAVANANVKLAYANGTADPTLEGEYDRSGTYNSAGFNLQIPIRIFDRNQGNKKTSEFALEGSRFGVVGVRNQVLSDVDQAWTGYVHSEALSTRYTQHYLDEATDVLTISQFAYDHGGLALIDYLDALRDSRQTTADALAAYAATWLAIHQLSYAAADPPAALNA